VDDMLVVEDLHRSWIRLIRPGMNDDHRIELFAGRIHECTCTGIPMVGIDHLDLEYVDDMLVVVDLHRSWIRLIRPGMKNDHCIDLFAGRIRECTCTGIPMVGIDVHYHIWSTVVGNISSQNRSMICYAEALVRNSNNLQVCCGSDTDMDS